MTRITLARPSGRPRLVLIRKDCPNSRYSATAPRTRQNGPFAAVPRRIRFGRDALRTNTMGTMCMVLSALFTRERVGEHTIGPAGFVKSPRVASRRDAFRASRWPKALPQGTLPHARAPQFVRNPWAPRPPLPCRSRLGRAPSTSPKPRPKPRFSPAPRSPASMRSFAKTRPRPGLAAEPRARRRQRAPGAAERRRGGAARRAPPRSAGRRSRTGETPAAGLARARGRISGTMALRYRGRRRSH